MSTIAECKKSSVLPQRGTPVITRPSDVNCGGFLVKQKYIDARREGKGIYRDFVGGCGGDVWWIEHEDGSIGAYMYTEVFDPEPVQKPRFRTYKRP